jgi:protein-S-isoprenylcysteine O-methyltransferase Ste14
MLAYPSGSAQYSVRLRDVPMSSFAERVMPRKEMAPPARIATAALALLAGIGFVAVVLSMVAGGWAWPSALLAQLLLFLVVDFGLVGAVFGEWPFTAWFGV